MAAREARRRRGPYAVEAVGRAIDILGVFTAAQPALDLRRIVELTGLPKTTAFRILETLAERGLCEKIPETRQYSLGVALLRLADVRRRQYRLHEIAMPVMREIRDKVGETVVLTIRVGDQRTHIDSAEGLHQFRRVIEPGRLAPLYAGAAGKVLLAGFDDGELEEFFRRTPLKPLLKNTITDRAVLMKQLKQVRERGFGESHSEIIPGGGGAVAAPIKDHTGGTLGAIDILTAEGRFTPQHRERCIKLLLEGTRRVSAKFGYQPAVDGR